MKPPNEASSCHQPFSVPQISQDELFAFHQSHFSTEALADFGHDFMNPTVVHEALAEPAYDEWEEEDDGLGYYGDGVKRTLTDEQIEIFRHSELRELRREQEKLAQAATRTTVSSVTFADDAKKSSSQPQGSGLLSDFRSKKKKKKKNQPKKEPKPDLRKRTWDVVEAGLDSLDYD